MNTEPATVPTGTFAALLDAIPHTKERDPELQVLELAVVTGLDPHTVYDGLLRLRWYGMARPYTVRGTWRLCWKTK